MTTFQTFAAPIIAQLETDITRFIDSCDLPSPLAEASSYAMMGGGKRVRPLLVASAFATVTGIPITPMSLPSLLPANVRRAMVAVECLHGYSLVHDDLPCMDDDDLRRGRPTTHMVYGEATALLAGDVLQSLAFESLTSPYFNPLTDDDIATTAALLAAFSPAARRMVAGQVLDLAGEGKQLSQHELEQIHRDKTGALIEAAVMMGAICAKANDAEQAALRSFATHLGLAFQVQDDILDVTASTDQLGKPAGSDEKLDKATYIKLMGLAAAQDYAQSLFYQAHDALLTQFDADNPLSVLANWLWQRQY